MKKFLSLVLALVMTMSLVTISAGAKDFTDNSSIKYEEAVKVMDLLGIINGYEDGSFKPANTLTRGAAAKIICNLLLTPEVAKDLAGSSTQFKDVPSTNTFSGYIAYCANQGIINGYADGTFKPAGTLNGYAFMKMLLGALGYDAEIEGYVKAGWEVNVAAKVSELKLAAGTTFNGTKAVTREEACLYAFNVLGTDMVKYASKGTSIPVNGGNLVIGNTPAASTGLTFAETKFAGLKQDTTDEDAFGRPITTWTYGKKTATVAASAVLTYTGAVTAKTLYTDLGLGKKATAEVNKLTVSKDSTVKEVLAGTGINTKTFVYATDEENVYDAIIVTYTLGTVSEVVKADAKNETNRAIKVAGKTYETEDFAKGDYVLYALGTDKDIADVIAPATVEGKVQRLTEKETKAMINGTAYAGAKNFEKVAAGAEGTFYLSLDGTTLIAIDLEKAGVKSDLYAYVYAVQDVSTKAGIGDDGLPVAGKTAFKVYYVNADGTKGSANVKDAKTAPATGVYNYALTDGEFQILGTPANGKATLAGKPALTADGKQVYATASTQYVFVSTANNKLAVSTVTGYANAKTEGEVDIYITLNDDGLVATVFVDGTPAGVKTAGLTAFMVNNSYDSLEDGVYSVKAYADGKEIDLLVKDTKVLAELAAISNGTYFGYEKNGEYVTSVDTKTYAVDASGKVENVIGTDYFVMGGNFYMFAKDVTVYTYDGAIKTATVADLAKDDQINVWTNKDGEVNMIVIVK